MENHKSWKNVKTFKRKLKAYMPLLHKKFGVASLAIFGSYVRSQQKKRSDLDLLVEFSKTPSLFEFIRLENHLKKLLGIKVDLVMKKALKPRIGQNILEEAVPV